MELVTVCPGGFLVPGRRPAAPETSQCCPWAGRPPYSSRAQAPGASASLLSARDRLGTPGSRGIHGHACRPLEGTSGRTYANQRSAGPEAHVDRLERASSVRSSVRSRPSRGESGGCWYTVTNCSALRGASTQCGREDSNLQPRSRPDPKFDTRLSSQSGPVRLVLIGAVLSAPDRAIRPVR